MWQFRQPAPSEFIRTEVDPPDPRTLESGEVLMRYRAGAICGSDIPKFFGRHDADNRDTGCPGAPLHEVVGIVEHSTGTRLRPGQRVVGIIQGARGLSEIIRNPEDLLVAVDDDELTDIEATVIQPVATVLSALSHAGDLTNKRIAVMGLGPLGVLFTHIAKNCGAAEVIGIDRVDRSDIAQRFGVDRFFHGEVRNWATASRAEDAPHIVVDAIGHQQEVVADAITAVGDQGTILVFGLADNHYVFPMRDFLRKGLTLWAGTTRDWQTYLQRAYDYVRRHADLRRAYLTDVYSLDHVSEAFRTYSVPRKGRVKVALTPPSTSSVPST